MRVGIGISINAGRDGWAEAATFLQEAERLGVDSAWTSEAWGFDAFTPLSHHGNVEISAEAQRNRFMLLGLMSAAGWDFYGNEWWHYQLFNAAQYPLLGDAHLPAPMM